jgi:hypothetical protein
MIGGPALDTKAGDIVVIVVSPEGNYGVKFVPDQDGCAAVIESFERVAGKFGPVQKHGGVHQGDILMEFNDNPLMNTKFSDVIRMITDKNVLKKELKFINSKEYYRRK